MVKVLRSFRTKKREKAGLSLDYTDGREAPRMRAGHARDSPMCCGCVNIRFFLMFLFTVLAILSGIDLYRRGAFEFDKFSFEIGFLSAVFIVSLLGALGTICESPFFMAVVTGVMLVASFISMAYTVYITYVFFMVEENVETLKEKSLLNPQVKKEDVDIYTYVFLTLPHLLLMLVAFVISGMTCALFDFYTA